MDHNKRSCTKLVAWASRPRFPWAARPCIPEKTAASRQRVGKSGGNGAQLAPPWPVEPPPQTCGKTTNLPQTEPVSRASSVSGPSWPCSSPSIPLARRSTGASEVSQEFAAETPDPNRPETLHQPNKQRRNGRSWCKPQHLPTHATNRTCNAQSKGQFGHARGFAAQLSNRTRTCGNSANLPQTGSMGVSPESHPARRKRATHQNPEGVYCKRRTEPT